MEVFKAGLGAEAMLADFDWVAGAVDEGMVGLGPVRLCKGLSQVGADVCFV